MQKIQPHSFLHVNLLNWEDAEHLFRSLWINFSFFTWEFLTLGLSPFFSFLLVLLYFCLLICKHSVRILTIFVYANIFPVFSFLYVGSGGEEEGWSNSSESYRILCLKTQNWLFVSCTNTSLIGWKKINYLLSHYEACPDYSSLNPALVKY